MLYNTMLKCDVGPPVSGSELFGRDAELARSIWNAVKAGQCVIGIIPSKKNPNPILVPCHRVVRSDGSVGGYAFGEAEKTQLLSSEGVKVRDGFIVDMNDTVYRF